MQLSEQKLDLILAELQKVNDRVTMIDDHAITMNERMTIIDKRITNIDNYLINVDTCITTIETEQQRHGNHIQQLIQLVGTTNTKLNKFEQTTIKHFSQIDRNLRLLESDFDLVLQKTNAHERAINRLKHVE